MSDNFRLELLNTPEPEHPPNRWPSDLENNADTHGANDAHGKPRLPNYNLYSPSDLAAMDLSVSYIIDDILVDQQPMIIGGKSKVLKSSIALELAIGIATGSKFLGHYECNKPQPVLFMSAESGLATLYAKAKAICPTFDDETTITLSDSVCRLDQPPHHLAIERDLKALEAKVLVIDPTYLSLPGDDMNNVFAQGEKLRDFAMFCQQLGVTLILVHHAKKTIRHYDPLELDDFAGAGFGEFARQWLLLNHREPMNPESLGQFRLWFTYGGSAGHFGGWALDITEGQRDSENDDWRKWEVELISMKDARKEQASKQIEAARDKKTAKHQAQIGTVEQEILARFQTLERNRGTLRDINAGCSVDQRNKAFGAAMARLVNRGDIEDCTIVKGNNKKEYDGYRRVFRPNH